MPSCVFDKCCGCIDLKTGCFIIGYLNLVGVFVLTLISAVIVIGGAVVAGGADDKDTHDAGVAITILGAIFLIFLLFALAFAIVLLVGLHKNKPGHLKAYMVYSLIFIIVTVIQLVVTCATSAIKPGDVVQNIIYIILSIYYLLVIRSMYFQMKDPSRGPAIYSAA